MAQEPVMDAPSVAGPKDLVAPNFRTGDSGPETFGAGVGRALQQTGDELFKVVQQQQGMKNEAEARDLSVQFETEIAAEKLKMGTLEGKSALDYQNKYAENIQAIRNKYLGMATSSDSKQMLSGQISRVTGSAIISGMGHVAQQTIQYNKNTMAARKENAISSAADPSLVGKDLEDQYNIAKMEAGEEVRGQSEDTVKQHVRDATTRFWSNKIGALVELDPMKAKAVFNKYKDDIDGINQERLTARIDMGVAKFGSTAAAQQAMGSGNLSTPGGRTDYAMSRATQEFGKKAAAGLIGNWHTESKMDPTAGVGNHDQADGTDSVGVSQWGKERKAALEKFAADAGRPWNDFKTQVEFGISELKQHPDILKRAQDAATPEEAARIIADAHIRPKGAGTGNTDNIKDIGSRVSNANRLFNGPVAESAITADTPEAKLEEVRNAAKATAERVADAQGLNPVARQYMIENSENLVTNMYNKKKQERNDAVNGHLQTLNAAMEPDDTGHAPTSENELAAKSPEVATAIKQVKELSPQSWLRINRHIGVSQRAEQNEVTPKRQVNFDDMYGLRQTSPKDFLMETEEARLHDMDLTPKQRLFLENERTKVLKNADVAPNVTHAMSVLKSSDVFGEGKPLDVKTPQGRQFFGALTTGMERFKASEKRDPSDQEILSMGRQLMVNKATPSTFMGIATTKNAPTYQGSRFEAGEAAANAAAIPDEARQLIRERFVKQFKKEPTEADISVNWNANREIFRKQHGIR
jgi:hypothetical protein